MEIDVMKYRCCTVDGFSTTFRFSLGSETRIFAGVESNNRKCFRPKLISGVCDCVRFFVVSGGSTNGVAPVLARTFDGWDDRRKGVRTGSFLVNNKFFCTAREPFMGVILK